MKNVSNAGPPAGNLNAAKPDDLKISGVGRLVCDLGEQKLRIIRACNDQRPRRTLVKYVREALEEKLSKDGF
jgi:hypothetical protein